MSKQELELPQGWIKTKLDNVVIRISNGTTEKQTKEKTKFPVTRIETISDAEINLNRVKYLRKCSKKILDHYKIELGDILFSNINSDLHLGKTAIFQLTDLNLIHGMNLLLIRSNSNIIIPKFLNFIFNYQRSSGYFFSIAHHAVNQSSINQTNLKKTPILLPPLNEQQRIVSKIEELFSKIDSAKQSLEHTKLQLEQYRASLLKSAFEGKLTEKWRTETKSIPDIEWSDYEKQKITIIKIYNENLKDIVNITNDWYWLNIKSLSESMKNGIYKEKKFYTDDGIACLRMYNIENWKLIWKKIKRMDLTSDEISEFELKPDDILFNRVNSMELVGKAALIPKNIEKCVYESKNIRLRFKTKYIKPKFIHMWLSFASRHYFNKNFQQTTGMASVNQGQLGNLPIPYCSLEEQEQIISKIEQGFSLIENTSQMIHSTLQILQTIKISILKQTFEGKLVPQDPNDESAQMLLERIKSTKESQSTKQRE